MKMLVKAALGLWIFVLLYFGYVGLTTVPTEGDSLAYHLPIASRILNGDFLRKETFDSNFYFYPATGELMLTTLMRLKIPLNLFGVVGWVWLTTAVFKLARQEGLSKEWSGLLAMGIATLTSTLRLIPSQTIDLFEATVLIECIRLMQKPERNLKYWGLLGILMGMLVGLKFSGIFYAGLLVLMWGKELMNYANLKYLLICVVMIIVGGGFWYIRNWMFTGQMMPLPYPTSVTGWVAKPPQDLPVTWLTVKNTPGGGGLFFESMWSEFLIWSILPFLIWLVKDKIYLTGFIVFWLYLWMPAAAGSLLSDFRYVIGGVALMGLGVVKKIQNKNWAKNLGVFLVLNMMMVLPQLEYRPKIILVSLIVTLIFVVSPRRAELATPLKLSPKARGFAVRGEKK